MRIVLAVSTILVVCSTTLASFQAPFKSGSKADNPHDTFFKHFSADRAGTGVYLQTQIQRAYPDKEVTVTQDPAFNLHRYAAVAEEPIVIRENSDIEPIKQTVFIKPSLPRGAKGEVAERVIFAGYDVAWRDYEFQVIVGTWAEGFSQLAQWHIISDRPDHARELVAAVAEIAFNFAEVIWVFDRGYWRPDPVLYQSIQTASWDDVILDDKFKKDLQNDYRGFFDARETYRRLGVPWKRGLIFLGPPGNGKTISIKAIMKEIKHEKLYVKSLNSYSGPEFGIREVFEFARRRAPCLVIFEDLDSIITDFNRAFFLNELDGIEDNDGLLLIGSTNHFDRLDPGLSNRPSRFDRKYKFNNPTLDERKQYALYWQDKLKNTKDIVFPDSLVETFATKTDEFSFAYMKEAFVSALLLIAGNKASADEFETLLMDQVNYLRNELGRAGKHAPRTHSIIGSSPPLSNWHGYGRHQTLASPLSAGVGSQLFEYGTSRIHDRGPYRVQPAEGLL